MAKQKRKKSKIKWRDSDRKKLAQAVRKFNAKRTREIKKNPEAEKYLPPKMNIREIEKAISTRQDFNYVINTLERFMRKDATKKIKTPGGKETTKWALDELRNANKRRNAKRKAKRDKANVSTEKGTMGTIDRNNLNPRTFNIKMDPKSWDKFVEQVKKELLDSYDNEKKQKYLENYLESLSSVYGLENAFNLNELLKDLSADDFTQAFHDDPILDIEYNYDNNTIEDLANIYEHWLKWIMENNIYG